jgi:hypothetical protein
VSGLDDGLGIIDEMGGSDGGDPTSARGEPGIGVGDGGKAGMTGQVGRKDEHRVVGPKRLVLGEEDVEKTVGCTGVPVVRRTSGKGEACRGENEMMMNRDLEEVQAGVPGVVKQVQEAIP